MPNQTLTASHILPVMPRLRVFRELDVDSLSPEFVEKVLPEEGTVQYVDNDKPRDLPFTEEIMENTIGAILVNPEGDIVAKFAGSDGWQKAQRAKETARVTFDLDLDDSEADDEEVE